MKYIMIPTVNPADTRSLVRSPLSVEIINWQTGWKVRNPIDVFLANFEVVDVGWFLNPISEKYKYFNTCSK